jgi:hypothetical protein
MTSRDQEEYSALRATIRERGTARVWTFLVGMIAWAALMTATATLSATPLSVVLPLLLLAAVFEAVLALHVGVERVGRYLQVFHEIASSGWEHAAMRFGKPRGAITTDPLFVVVFACAAIVNLTPALVLSPSRSELIVVGGAHVLFLLRLMAARAGAARQRAIDLERFQALTGDEK